MHTGGASIFHVPLISSARNLANDLSPCHALVTKSINGTVKFPPAFSDGTAVPAYVLGLLNMNNQMTALTGTIMAMYEIAVKFDESERALIQGRAEAAGMSFSEFVRRAALEKVEDMADIEAYGKALDEDDDARYSMDDVMRMAMWNN